MASTPPVVHLELHTGDSERARDVYAELCGWVPRQIDTRHGSYLSLGMGGEVGGGIVECAARRPLWLPYVEVGDICDVTERARELGASVPLDPREGALGWRSVVSSPAAGELALWQPKEPPRLAWPRRAVSAGER